MHGWCSPEAIEQVACVMRVTPAYLESVASFYDMLETEPGGRHSIYVCTNISCSLRGADVLYEAASRAVEGADDVNVRAFECLGACDIAPMASVDGVYVGPLTRRTSPRCSRTSARRDVLPDRQPPRWPTPPRTAASFPGRSHDPPNDPRSRRARPSVCGRIAARTAPLEPRRAYEEDDS